MKYCFECGSEINDADIFCPFCGISLNNLIAPANEIPENPQTLLPVKDPDSTDVPTEADINLENDLNQPIFSAPSMSEVDKIKKCSGFSDSAENDLPALATKINFKQSRKLFQPMI